MSAVDDNVEPLTSKVDGNDVGIERAAREQIINHLSRNIW